MATTNTPSTGTPLQLFPSPSSYAPRKSNLKQPRSATSSPAQAGMKGVALQVTTTRPAHSDRGHSPSDTNDASPATLSSNMGGRTPSTRRQHARKRSSVPNFSKSPIMVEPLVNEDQLCPLPINTSFTPSSPPRIRTPVARLKRPTTPKSISTPTARDDSVATPIDDDQLSPLPTKLSFKPAATPKQEYPSPVSFRSDGSTLVRSNSDATGRYSSGATSNQPTRSMFPQYDHSKPLSQQQYFPLVTSSPSTGNSSDTRNSASSAHWPALKREDSAVALCNSYPDVPRASSADVLTIWHASTTSCPPTGRRVQLDLEQPKDQNMSLTLGADGKTLYSMQSNAPSPTSKPTLITEPKDLTIHKTCPESALPMPTAYLSLPPPSTQQTATSPPATLFPHQAALDAIQAAATSPLASTIALTDPTGSSPAAARLAQNALAQAHSHHTSTIRRTSRSRSASGSLSATYALAHASLGSLPITVSPATTGSGPDARAKISLHHPRATPAALAAQTLALLTLDFGAGVAVLDTPGLLALDEPYVLDVAVAAVLAVAVLENEMVRREAVEFAPPPTRMTMAGKVVDGDFLEGKEGSNAGGKDAKKLKREERKRRDRERGKEPGLVRETVSLVGMGVRGAVWLVGAGLKAARESAR